MNVMQILRMIWARRALILISMLVCVALAAAVGKMFPQQYEAKSRVMLDTLRPDPVTGQAMNPQSNKAFVQAQTELIRDYRVAGAVVDHFGWERSPTLAAAYAARPAGDERDFRRWLAQIVIDNTSVGLTDLNSNILEISYRSTSPDTARIVAEAIREAYIDQAVLFRRENAAKNAAWFREQGEKLKVDLAAAEQRKSEFEQANNIILQDDNMDTETAKLRALANTAPSISGPAQMSMAPPPSPSAAQLAQIDAQIAASLQTLGPNHPDIVTMRRQRDAVAASAAREQAAGRVTSGPTGPSIASMISAQAQKVLAQRGLVGQAQRLAGEVTVLRDQLSKTTTRAADFELQAQSTDVGLERLGNAVAPDQPVSPLLLLFILGGLVVGAGLGIVIALVLELAFRRVRGAEDLAIDGLPLLGSLRTRTPRNLAYLLGFTRTERRTA